MRREENRVVDEITVTFSSGLNRKYPKEREVDKVFGSARLPSNACSHFPVSSLS